MSLGQGYFEGLYQQDRDPWGFRTRWYERRKRQLTMAALPEAHYDRVFEPGCSIGVLTRELATRSGSVLAMDISAHALEQARVDRPANVELRRGSVPADWPPGRFGLIVLSEMGYYLDEPDCRRLAQLAMASAGDLIAVHWRHPVDDYPLTGDQFHAILDQMAARHELSRICSHVEADFRLAVWSRDHRSVAARTGLLRS
jgi:trans-aconitate methyltransferase